MAYIALIIFKMLPDCDFSLGFDHLLLCYYGTEIYFSGIAYVKLYVIALQKGYTVHME